MSVISSAFSNFNEITSRPVLSCVEVIAVIPSWVFLAHQKIEAGNEQVIILVIGTGTKDTKRSGVSFV